MFAKWVEQDGRFAFSERDNGGVSIGDAQYRELFAGQDRGLQIVMGPDGAPILSEQSAPPKEIQLELRLREKAARMEAATRRIVPLQDAVDLGIASDSDTATLTALKRYRIDLNAVDISAGPVEWPVEPA